MKKIILTILTLASLNVCACEEAINIVNERIKECSQEIFDMMPKYSENADNFFWMTHYWYVLGQIEMLISIRKDLQPTEECIPNLK